MHLHLSADIRDLLSTQAELYRSNETKDRRRRIFAWLRPLARIKDKYEERCKGNVVGTGDLILRQEKYARWMGTRGGADATFSDRILWISGIPGAGKTGIATRIISTLQDARTRQVAYFYCETQQSETIRLVAILRTWCSQLLWQSDSLDLLNEFEEASICEREPSESCLLKCLEGLCDTLPAVFLVVDGLDEREQRGSQKLIADVLPALSVRTKVVIVSQRAPDIAKRLDERLTNGVLIHLHMSTSDNADDIEKFCIKGISKVTTSSDLRLELSAALISRANGMFQ